MACCREMRFLLKAARQPLSILMVVLSMSKCHPHVQLPCSSAGLVDESLAVAVP